MKSIIAEQPFGEEHWNVWEINGEEKILIAQIKENDAMTQLLLIRKKVLETPGINFTNSIKELKKIIDWKEEKVNERKRYQPRFEEINKQPTNEVVDEKAKEIMNHFILRTIEDTQEIYYYEKESGIYAPAERMLEGLIENTLDKKSTSRIVKEVIEKIKRTTYIPRGEENNSNLVPVKNGIYDVMERRLLEFSPEYFFTSKHPIEYFPQNHCPKINKFIDEVTEGDIEKSWLLEKIAAYTFYRGYPIHKAFMLLGSGSNGKSVYLNLLRTMLGNEHVCAIQLQDLAENRFAAGNLYGKNANIFADLESHALKSTGLFKALTGGDYITCDQKFKKSFPFINSAKLIFSCNQLPETKDETDAFFRRWIIVEFTRQFDTREQNPNLINEITTPEEISGFFDQLMSQLRELLEQNKFTDESIDETRDKYMRNANSGIAFANECLEIDPDGETQKTKIWSKYRAFCIEKKLPLFNEKRFWPSLINFFGDKVYESHVKNSLTKERYRVLRGINLIEDKDETNNDLRDLSEKILEKIRSYKGVTCPKVPYDFVLDNWEDLVRVKELIIQMRKNGILYEPQNGYISIDTSKVLVKE